MKLSVRIAPSRNLIVQLLTGHPSSADRKGSVSAEHGIGSMKTDALHYSKSDVSIDCMRKIKQVFDPLNIMNPGKVLP
jgi:FAD/FMN-containing dehydrogenase